MGVSEIFDSIGVFILNGCSEDRRQAAALGDRALGIQFRGDVGASDQMRLAALCGQRIEQLAARFLPGADHDVVDSEHLLAAIDADVQARAADVAGAIEVMKEHASVIKRPVAEWDGKAGGRVTVGFDIDKWSELLGG